MSSASQPTSAAARRRINDLAHLLSKVLRHTADKLGLPIQEGGWVPVEDIRRLPDFSDYTISDFEQAVASNDKQRFEMRKWGPPDGADGVLFIRATQGHSIERISSEALLREIKDPHEFPVTIHGTYVEVWPAIEQKGLSRMGRKHIHMIGDDPTEKEVMSGFRRGTTLLIYIDMAAAMAAGIRFFVANNRVILSEGDSTGCIPPAFFSKTAKWDPRRKRVVPAAPLAGP